MWHHSVCAPRLSHFALRTGVIFILWAFWSSRNPKNVPPYFCRSEVYLISELRQIFCVPEHITFYERSAMFLCSGAHFILRMFRQMFCGQELTSSQERSVKLFALRVDEKVFRSVELAVSLSLFLHYWSKRNG